VVEEKAQESYAEKDTGEKEQDDLEVVDWSVCK